VLINYTDIEAQIVNYVASLGVLRKEPSTIPCKGGHAIVEVSLFSVLNNVITSVCA